MYWTFYVVVGIVLLFISYLIARAIYQPIKLQRERRRYIAWKNGTQEYPHVFR